MPLIATARVQLTIEYHAGVWDENCTLEQIYKQAAREAIESIERTRVNGSMNIIGTPKVTAILVDKKE